MDFGPQGAFKALDVAWVSGLKVMSGFREVVGVFSRFLLMGCWDLCLGFGVCQGRGTLGTTDYVGGVRTMLDNPSHVWSMSKLLVYIFSASK